MRLADIDTDVETGTAAIGELRAQRHELEHARSQVRLVLGVLRTRIDLVETVRAARHRDASATERLEVLLAALPGLDSPAEMIDPDLRAEVDLEGGLQLAQVPHAAAAALANEIDRLLRHQRRLTTVGQHLDHVIDRIQVEIADRYRLTSPTVTT